MLTASEIYARSQGTRCEGKEKCHYCGCPCDQNIRHPEPMPQIGVRRTTGVANQSGAYMCVGCQLWNRTRVTAVFLGRGLADGQRVAGHSWWVTPQGAWAVAPHSVQALWEKLLNPPCEFVLALLEAAGEDGRPIEHRLHKCVANVNAVVDAQTELRFTVNESRHDYTVYDLRQAVRGDHEGTPGVAALVRLFGRPPKEMVPKEEHGELPEVRERPPAPSAKGGRPPAPPREPDPRSLLKSDVVTKSGG